MYGCDSTGKCNLTGPTYSSSECIWYPDGEGGCINPTYNASGRCDDGMVSVRFSYDGEGWDECVYTCSASLEGKYVQKNVCREGESYWGPMDFLDTYNTVCVKIADGVYVLSDIWEGDDSWGCQDSCRNGECNVEPPCYTEFDANGNCVYPEASGYYECTEAFNGVRDADSCSSGALICHMELSTQSDKGLDASYGECLELCTGQVGATRVKQNVCTTDTLSDITETCTVVGSKNVWIPTKSDNKAKCKNGCKTYSFLGCEECGDGECVYIDGEMYSADPSSNLCRNFKDGSYVAVTSVGRPGTYSDGVSTTTCLEPCDPSAVGTKKRDCTNSYLNESMYGKYDFVCTKIGDSYVWLDYPVERCDYGCNIDGSCNTCSAANAGQVIWSHCGGSYNNYTVIDDKCVRDGSSYEVRSSVVNNCKFGCTEDAGSASCDECPKRCENGCDENGTCLCPEPCQGEEVCNINGVCEIPMCPVECPYDCDDNRVCRTCDETCTFCNHDGLCRDGACFGCEHCDNEGVCHDEEPCFMYESCFWQDSCFLTDNAYSFKKTVWNITSDNLYLTYPYRSAELFERYEDGFCGYGPASSQRTWCTIDWGDGTTSQVVDQIEPDDESPCAGGLTGWQEGYSHKYAAPGVYTVETDCDFNLYFYSHCDYDCYWMMGNEYCSNVCFADDDICKITERLLSFEE